MNPWWSQAWGEHWGPALFHGAFWPLMAIVWVLRPPRRYVPGLCIGIAIGLLLIVAGLIAIGLGQPSHVWGRLLLFGGIFEMVHTSLLVAMVFGRREHAPAQTGGVS